MKRNVKKITEAILNGADVRKSLSETISLDSIKDALYAQAEGDMLTMDDPEMDDIELDFKVVKVKDNPLTVKIETTAFADGEQLSDIEFGINTKFLARELGCDVKEIKPGIFEFV